MTLIRYIMAPIVVADDLFRVEHDRVTVDISFYGPREAAGIFARPSGLSDADWVRAALEWAIVSIATTGEWEDYDDGCGPTLRWPDGESEAIGAEQLAQISETYLLASGGGQ